MSISSVEQLRPLRRAEYDQLISHGAFQEERIELIDGALVRMSPIGPPHCATVARLMELLVLALGVKARVLVQSSFAAGEISQPEPDLSVVPRADYDDAHPHLAHLIVEVADSSLNQDRGRKARLYAECGVPEYWVVNLVDRRVEVFTEPLGGAYQCLTNYEKGARICLTAFPELELAVDDFVK